MAQATIINKFGKLAGWNSLTFRIFNRNVEAFKELSYNDKQGWTNEYGGGKFPIGEGEQNYETENCYIDLYQEEIIALQASLPKGSRIMDAPATEGIAAYEYQGKIYKDRLNNIRIMNNGRNIKQGDGTIVTRINLKVSHIDWNI